MGSTGAFFQTGEASSQILMVSTYMPTQERCIVFLITTLASRFLPYCVPEALGSAVARLQAQTIDRSTRNQATPST